MYQTVGHHAIDAYSEAMGVPLYRGSITGAPLQSELYYEKNDKDEVEDLYQLLKTVKVLITWFLVNGCKEHHPDLEAVSSGAILSNYQRNRVENVYSLVGG